MVHHAYSGCHRYAPVSGGYRQGYATHYSDMNAPLASYRSGRIGHTPEGLFKHWHGAESSTAESLNVAHPVRPQPLLRPALLLLHLFVWPMAPS